MKTAGVVLVVHPDGHMERVRQTFPMPLDFLHEAVGGYIEAVRLTVDLMAIVNGGGRLLGMPPNQRYPNLCGPLVLCSDWEYELEEEGPDGHMEKYTERDFGPLNEAQLRMLEGGGVSPGPRTAYMDRTQTIPDQELTVRIISAAQIYKETRPRGKG
jgi:hypothetical protein